MYTFDNLQMQFGSVLIWTERITVAFFAVDYILRLLTARLLYEDEKDMTELRALRKYFFSFMGIIDLPRQSIIVLVKRRNKSLIPNGNMRLEPGDRVFIYTKLHLSDANNIEI